ncbi:dnaJ homolog subfamily C member 27-like [Saccoglossus kowalevskii]|uniref:DnaJ homolog subfamily C member 27-like n=1 Tax=Saccoglossus kowalevskii TaxID=10224 RepID=A0ABM0H1E4_SACKO|nr:PREDICTED: dnaJ homolog subfamily C member 27-like [Saccoglossus kowalevskii]
MDRSPGHLSKNVKDIVDSLVWIKVVAVGSVGVGKTCLIKHFCESKFTSSYQATVGVDYGFKIQNINGTDLRVHLWDLSGHPDYADVRSELYRDTQACFIVYDVTNSASFEHLELWLKELLRCGAGNSYTLVVANKTDLDSKRVISVDEGRKWAAAHKLKYYETSAHGGDGIEKMFTDLLTAVVSKKPLQYHGDM